ncbi:hypothetical protein [Lederbergia graminis]|uniref:Transposase n=1 Tax=Lederbergia graminis TaxID=735518 RepID=A0ABW0LJW1_9BACI
MSYKKEFTQEELDFIGSLPNSWMDRGRKEGYRKAQINIATKMLDVGLPNDIIARLSELDISVVKEISKGFQQGLQEGRQKATVNFALKLLKEGFPLEKIARITALDLSKIEELSKRQ